MLCSISDLFYFFWCVHLHVCFLFFYVGEKDSHCVAVTACKSSHGQESYLRVLDDIFISKEYSILEKQKKNLIPKTIINCGDIEENPGVLDQCYSNNNFVTAAVLGVTNYVLLGTRLYEFNRIAVDVGGVGDLDFECVTKMDDISILLIRSDNQ